MSEQTRPSRPWALSGILAVALSLAGLILAGALTSGAYPTPASPTAELARFFAENRTAVRVLVVCQALAAVALLVFAASVAAAVQRTPDGAGAPAGLTLSGGVLAAAFLLLSALFSWAVIRPETLRSPALVRAIFDLAFLTGGPAYVLWLAPFIGVSSAAALTTPIVPRWVAWLGVVVATASLLSVASLILEPAQYLLPIGRFGGFAWIIAVSVALARSRRHEADAERTTSVGSTPDAPTR